MIRELVELSERLPKAEAQNDALDYVPTSISCVIDKHGNFKSFLSHEKKTTLAERIIAKKGKARLLVDKAEEVLMYGDNSERKHKLFLEKLSLYKELAEISPVISFYYTNRKNGLDKAQPEFAEKVNDKEKGGNISFVLDKDLKRLNEQDAIYNAITLNYQKSMAALKDKRFGKCSICGSEREAITDLPHGMLKRVPDGQTSGCALVSYNFNAAESYGLNGNENSSVCVKCARAYVESLNWLLSNGTITINEKGKETLKYKNRKNISNDTAVIFWVREARETPLLDILDNPTEDSVLAMFDSVAKGQKSNAAKLQADTFYAITLSGAAARIAVRDWIEISLENLRQNLVRWFEDIEVNRYDSDHKEIVKYYPSLRWLTRCVKGKSDNEVRHGRIGALLWKCAVIGYSPPLWLIGAVLNRIRAELGNATAERIVLLKLYLNRKINQQERNESMTQNIETAKTCGKIFAVLESIQYHASGGNLNAGIRERFFSFASTMPSTAFGRLLKLSQHHLSKIRGDKPGLAVNLDKRLGELVCSVSEFPASFSLEEQAGFAIGYYCQRQKEFTTKQNKEE